MNFRDYHWFKNPRGLRNDGPYLPTKPERYSGPRMGWARLVAGGTEHVDTVKALVAQSCMPIVSLYRERMGAAPAPNAWYDLYLQYIDAGGLWLELYEEPNTETFWPLGPDGRLAANPDWNAQECIRPLMDNWLTWAELIIRLGGYPAFPAMAETVEPRLATVKWLEVCLRYLKETAADRFMAVLSGGLWCATHPYVMNHFYQEPPGGPASAQRPFYQQSASEEGWHFEYPYDPVQQHDDPGRTAFGGTAKSPNGDPNGLVATGEVFQELLRSIFGAGPVPVIGTAGGIHPIPAPGGNPVQQDSRYLPYSRDSHGEATLAMFQWIARQGPPWLFGVALSAEADYYGGSNPAPAIELLLSHAAVLKDVPDLDTAHGIAVSAAPRPPEPEPEPAPAPDILWPEPLLDTVEPSSPVTSPEAAAVEPGAPPPEPPVPADPLPQLLQEPLAPPEPEPVVSPQVSEPPASLSEPGVSDHPLAPEPAAGSVPGSVMSLADYHWLMPAPDLPERWFWKAAWRYWDAFRLTVIPSADLIGCIPPQKSVAVTIIAQPAALDALKQSILSVHPHVRIDAVAAASLEALQAELDRRAGENKEFG